MIIPDLIFHPGSWIQGWQDPVSRIRNYQRILSILTQKIRSEMFILDPGSWILDLDFFIPDPDPGSRSQKRTGSGFPDPSQHWNYFILSVMCPICLTCLHFFRPRMILSRIYPTRLTSQSGSDPMSRPKHNRGCSKGKWTHLPLQKQ